MNFPTLFKITPEPFALDLSDRSIKIVKLSRGKGGIFLENFGNFEVEEGAMEDGVITEEAKLVSALYGALGNLKGGKIGTQYAACSLPEQKTFNNVVQLPKMKEEELANAIQWEVEANVPLSLSEIYFDWQVLQRSVKSKDHFDILVSAAAKDTVDSYVRALEKVGIKPFSFEPESVAITRSIVKKGFFKDPVLVVDFGRTRTSFVIYAGYSIRFSSSVKLSGALITQNIMRALGMNEEEAVKMKEEVGIDEKQNDVVYEAIVPALTDLKQQITQYIEFYATRAAHAHDSASKVEKILLSGGGARIRGLEKHLTVALGIPVEIANPWVNILKFPLKEIPEMPFMESVRYTTAFGLALGTL